MSERKKRGGWTNPSAAANGWLGGRPHVKVEFRRGDVVIVHRTRLGDVAPEEIGTVLSVSRDELEVQIGDDILVLRHPDDEP